MLKNNIKVILLAFITSIAFSINFCTVTDEAAQEGFQKIYSLMSSINRLILSFDTVSLASILMLILLFIFYKKADIGINSVRTRILSTVLSIMLSLSIVIGGCFYQYGAIDLLNKGIVQSLKTFIAVFGYALFFYYMINFVSVKYGSRQIIYNNFKISIFEKSHSLIIIAVILLLAWLPSIWAYYPAMFMGDSEDIIYMSYNYPTGLINTVDLVNEDVYITNHHSAAYTLFIGAVLKFVRYGGGGR